MQSTYLLALDHAHIVSYEYNNCTLVIERLIKRQSDLSKDATHLTITINVDDSIHQSISIAERTV